VVQRAHRDDDQRNVQQKLICHPALKRPRAPPPLLRINPGNLTRGPVTEQPTNRPRRPKVVKLTRARETVKTLHLPLGRTALCLDCETCFEIGTDRCPVCGSGTWASVARFLYGRRDP